MSAYDPYGVARGQDAIDWQRRTTIPYGNLEPLPPHNLRVGDLVLYHPQGYAWAQFGRIDAVFTTGFETGHVRIGFYERRVHFMGEWQGTIEWSGIYPGHRVQVMSEAYRYLRWMHRTTDPAHIVSLALLALPTYRLVHDHYAGELSLREALQGLYNRLGTEDHVANEHAMTMVDWLRELSDG